MYADYEIREVPIGYGPARRKVEEFLGKRTLRLDKVDYYEAIYPCGGDEMLAVGGLLGDAIRCIAVKEGMEDEHLANRLVSHLMVIVQRRGYPTVKVFTKPSNKAVFESLAFETVAETDSVVFMENGQMPLRDYLLSLERLARPGKTGVIVMNCNPFTRGHRYLIEEASKQVDNLYVIPLKENNRNFNYEERREMIRLGTADLANVTVCEGSAYAISQATFPTYFLKQLDKASENQIELDLQIFARYLAPALGATVRFVGTEPFDPLTRRYNEMMTELLPKSGIEVVQIERKELEEKPISASRTRAFIENNKLHAAMQLVPPTTQPYIMAKFAVDALQQELDTTPKPGLVDKDNSGAHTDMDYILMERSIKSLRPYFVRLAQLGLSADKLTTADVQRIGIEAEAAMLRTTHGVNTHRGALFALGITVAAAMWLYAHEGQEVRKERLQQMIQEIAAGSLRRHSWCRGCRQGPRQGRARERRRGLSRPLRDLGTVLPQAARGSAPCPPHAAQDHVDAAGHQYLLPHGCRDGRDRAPVERRAAPAVLRQFASRGRRRVHPPQHLAGWLRRHALADDSHQRHPPIGAGAIHIKNRK